MKCDECGAPIDWRTEHRFERTDGRKIETLCGRCCPRCEMPDDG